MVAVVLPKNEETPDDGPYVFGIFWEGCVGGFWVMTIWLFCWKKLSRSSRSLEKTGVDGNGSGEAGENLRFFEAGGIDIWDCEKL